MLAISQNVPYSIYLLYEKLHIKGVLGRAFALGSKP
jgi:hypothetical protein